MALPIQLFVGCPSCTLLYIEYQGVPAGSALPSKQAYLSSRFTRIGEEQAFASSVIVSRKCCLVSGPG